MAFIPRRALLTLLFLSLTSCSEAVPMTMQTAPAKTMTPAITDTSLAPNPIQKRIPLPVGAGAVAFGDGSIWVVNRAEHHILRIDIRTGETAVPPFALDFEPHEITYGEGAVWVCSADRSRLVRIDPETNQVVAQVDLRDLQIHDYDHVTMAAGEGAVWITDQVNVIQIDPTTNQLVGDPLPAGEETIVTALGHGTLWTGSHDDGIIARVDANTHRVVATIDMGFAVHGLAVSDESAWVLDEHGFAVVRIDPQTNQIEERVPIDFVAANLTAGAGSVWVAPAARDSGQFTGNDGIVQVSESTKQIVETIHVGDVGTSDYYSVYFGEGFVWVLINTPQPGIVQIVP